MTNMKIITEKIRVISYFLKRATGPSHCFLMFSKCCYFKIKTISLWKLLSVLVHIPIQSSFILPSRLECSWLHRLSWGSIYFYQALGVIRDWGKDSLKTKNQFYTHPKDPGQHPCAFWGPLGCLGSSVQTRAHTGHLAHPRGPFTERCLQASLATATVHVSSLLFTILPDAWVPQG